MASAMRPKRHRPAAAEAAAGGPAAAPAGAHPCHVTCRMIRSVRLVNRASCPDRCGVAGSHTTGLASTQMCSGLCIALWHWLPKAVSR